MIRLPFYPERRPESLEDKASAYPMEEKLYV